MRLYMPVHTSGAYMKKGGKPIRFVMYPITPRVNPWGYSRENLHYSDFQKNGLVANCHN